jgi:toxin ParE1/3/4
MRVRFTTTALSEVDEICAYIAAANPRAASEMRERIERAAARLRDNAAVGPETDEPGVRQLTVTRSPYLIFYTVGTNETVILHVRHGARRRPWEVREK